MTDQRFENWKLRRALARPYFLRSTVRLSRVRKPACLDERAQQRFLLESAWAMPCFTAPACPESPPPLTVAITSILAGAIGNAERLVDDETQRRTREIDFLIAAVDRDLACAGL
jgi:hypothetical protein